MTEGEYVGGTDGNNGYWLTDEPIIRCRDCIYYDTVHLDCARQGWSDCERDGFCSWGERRNDDNRVYLAVCSRLATPANG